MGNNNDLISIIVPVYNAEQYLKKCLESIIRQTYENLEIVLIDDGSTDNSGKICDEFALFDKRIKTKHKDNGGVSSARNIGLDIAAGKYVTFVDADDFIDKDYISILYKNITKYHADFSMCKYAIFDDDKVTFIKEDLPNVIEVDIKSQIFIKYICRYISFKRYIFGGSVRVLYKKSNIEHIRFNQNIKISEDLLFLLQSIMVSRRIVSSDSPLYFYRRVSTSATHSYKANFLESQTELYKQLKCLFDLFNSKYAEKIFKTQSALLVYYLFSNELKFKPSCKKDNIIKIKNSELYKLFNLRYGLKVKGLSKKFKFLAVWVLIKFKIY